MASGQGTVGAHNEFEIHRSLGNRFNDVKYSPPICQRATQDDETAFCKAVHEGRVLAPGGLLLHFAASLPRRAANANDRKQAFWPIHLRTSVCLKQTPKCTGRR